MRLSPRIVIERQRTTAPGVLEVARSPLENGGTTGQVEGKLKAQARMFGEGGQPMNLVQFKHHGGDGDDVVINPAHVAMDEPSGDGNVTDIVVAAPGRARPRSRERGRSRTSSTSRAAKPPPPRAAGRRRPPDAPPADHRHADADTLAEVLLERLVVRHVIIFGYGHGLQRAIIDESQHRTPERLIMAQH